MTPRGGPRKNAGRKPLRDGERRVVVTMRLLPQTKWRLEKLAEFHDVSQSQVIDMLVSGYGL